MGTMLRAVDGFKPGSEEGSDLGFSYSSFEVSNNGNLDGSVIGDGDTLEF